MTVNPNSFRLIDTMQPEDDVLSVDEDDLKDNANATNPSSSALHGSGGCCQKVGFACCQGYEQCKGAVRNGQGCATMCNTCETCIKKGCPPVVLDVCNACWGGEAGSAVKTFINLFRGASAKWSPFTASWIIGFLSLLLILIFVRVSNVEGDPTALTGSVNSVIAWGLFLAIVSAVSFSSAFAFLICLYVSTYSQDPSLSSASNVADHHRQIMTAVDKEHAAMSALDEYDEDYDYDDNFNLTDNSSHSTPTAPSRQRYDPPNIPLTVNDITRAGNNGALGPSIHAPHQHQQATAGRGGRSNQTPANTTTTTTTSAQGKR